MSTRSTVGAGPRQFSWRGLRVPWIAPWTREQPLVAAIVPGIGSRGRGIGYADEDDRTDRRNGALWVRVPSARGIGGPQLASVHALRQRQAMHHMLCQVCGRPARQPDGRHLFLMRDKAARPIAEGEKTAVPPIHRDCAIEAAQDCPHLRKGHVAALVDYAPAWGVAGIVYDPKALLPLPGQDDQDLTFVAYDDERLPWTLAARDVVVLHGCTPVDVSELVAAGALTSNGAAV
ncbi:hypothetical protein ACWD0A_27505 [Streptomyces sp. NPDC002867]